MIRRIGITLLLVLSVVYLPMNLYASDHNALDLLAKVYKFIQGIKPGQTTNVSMGVVYDVTSPGATATAEHLIEDYRAKSDGSVGFVLKLVPVQELASFPDLQMAFIVGDPSAYYEEIKSFSSEHHIFTLSNELDCLEAEICILGIDTKDNVTIYLQESVLRAQGFSVNAAFKFLAKRL